MILDREEIERRIPHRPPMLLIDKIIEFDEGKRGVGVKLIKHDEHFFMGHFPDRPVMPGVYLIECMAQVAAAVLSKHESTGSTKNKYIAKITDVTFKKPVIPGDKLFIKVELVKKFGSLAKVAAKIEVVEETVALGQLILWDEDRD